MTEIETVPTRFAHLSAMKQTGYVLELILAGKTNDQIIALCGNDERLVYACTEFLKELKWLKESKTEAKSSDVTASGLEGIDKHGQK